MGLTRVLSTGVVEVLLVSSSYRAQEKLQPTHAVLLGLNGEFFRRQ